MRTIAFILLAIAPIISFEQNKVQPANIFCNSFSEQLKQQIMPDSVIISPKLHHDNSFPPFDFSYPLPGIHENGINQKNNFLTDNSTAIYSRMPIVKGDFQPNMPIAVPDSSVHYFILNKKIEMINPLDK